MKIRTKLLLPVVSLFLIAAVVVVFVISMVTSSIMERSVLTANHATLKSIDNGLDAEGRALLELASLFARRQGVIDAYRVAHSGNIKDEKDPQMQKARDMLRTLMNEPNAGYRHAIGRNSLKIQFHMPESRSLVRIWRKINTKRKGKWLDLSDDMISFRKTVAEVNKHGKCISGIELGRTGFTIHGLAPIVDRNGKQLGSNEVVSDYLNMVKRFKTDKRQQFALYMDEDFLKITRKLQNKPDKHPVLVGKKKKFVLVGSTNRRITDKIVSTRFLEAGLKQISDFHVANSLISVMPVKDYEGKIIGSLALASDVSETLAIIHSVRRWTIVGALVALALIIIIIFLGANRISSTILVLVDALDEFALGNIDKTIDVNTNDELGEFANNLRVMADAQKEMVYAARAIANGDLSTSVNTRSEKDILAHSLNDMVRTIKRVIINVDELATSVAQGKLDDRGNADEFSGSWKDVVDGINMVAERSSSIIQMTGLFLDRIGNGNIPDYIEEDWRGDYNHLRDSINLCSDNIRRLISDTKKLADAAVAGRLDERVDALKHPGDYALIIKGTNNALDAMASPIVEAKDVLSRLANYDMRARMKGDYQGDHAKLKESLNSTTQALHDALLLVSDAAEQIRCASSQIASASTQVANGATEQAAALEQTSASLADMDSQTSNNTKATEQTRELTQHSRDSAHRGNQSMQHMSDAMNKIQKASDDTSQIIHDINEIAFQTNLLALNAAVEAARAGEAGRGFAVVAEEVRNLAQRSKDAAAKTAVLIEDSISHARNGMQYSDKVKDELNDIVESISEVNKLVEVITFSNKEQAEGISQISIATQSMESTVQAAAASAEEASSSTIELADQAKDLAQLVDRFQLNRQESASNHFILEERASSNNQSVVDDDADSVEDSDWLDF